MPTRLAVLVVAATLLPSAIASAQDDDAARVAANKETILSRIQRDPVDFRGDKPNEMRLRWEWWMKVYSNYLYEKDFLVEELSAGEKYQLRPEWVFADMKVTFQDVFQLDAEHDDKLVPLLALGVLQGDMPVASFEGLTLLGKKGEVKGPFRRKLLENSPNGLRVVVQYEDEKGELKEAGGLSFDAFTVRWRDIKDRVVDEVSVAKAREDLELRRDAREGAN